MDSGDLDGAQAAFEKVVAELPDNADARFNLGNVLFNKGKYGPAADNYREAIRLSPNMARAHYNRGMALSRLSDVDGAKAEFKEANRLDSALVSPN